MKSKPVRPEPVEACPERPAVPASRRGLPFLDPKKDSASTSSARTGSSAKIDHLDPAEADRAAALWAEVGLVRAWNDPHADIAAALACPTSTILAARDGSGRIVGTVMAGYDGHRGWLYYVAVADDQRGTGLGRSLVEAAEQWLEAQGARVIRLMVRGENEAVLGFYEALGYEDGEMIVMGKRLPILPRQGEVAPQATEGEDGNAA